MLHPPLNQLPSTALLIGSKRLMEASGGRQDHIYAATGDVTVTFPLAGSAEIDAAVREAERALPGWRRLCGYERAKLLHGIGDMVLRHADELASIQTIETGTPSSIASVFPENSASYFFYNSGWADKIGGDVVTAGPTSFDYTLDEPYGVVGAIVPWNSSLIGTSQVLAPILAAGNTVVLKPSELAPFTSLRLAELALEAGMPSGVINVVTGGAVAGKRLVQHPVISKIHLTGSQETGRKVLAIAAERLVPVSLELGGKSTVLVYSDADLMAAAQVSLSAFVGLSGQGCTLPARVLVQKEVYDKFLLLLKGLLRRIVVGDPLEHSTQIGPLVSAQACERVLTAIEQALKNRHGRLIAGGNRMDGNLESGYFIEPTIFGNVVEQSELFTDEIFGPVLLVTGFDRHEDAIQIANRGRYGLAAFVFTSDLRRAHEISAALEAGVIWINGLGALDPSMPFGGRKQSGYGRLGGREGIREFTRPKNVWLPLTRRT